jgi:hypothetical protein
VKTGTQAGRGKSFQRKTQGSNGSCAANNRARLSDSQREQGPEIGSDATHREFIRRPAHPQTVSGQRPGSGGNAWSRHGSRSGRDSESGPSEREKLRRVNPKSGHPEQSGRRSRAMDRQGRRNVAGDRVLAGTPAQKSARIKHAVGANNLTKAATAREGRRSRSGETLKERQSLRETVMG